MLVFPLDVTSPKAPAELGANMADSIKTAISAVPGYLAIPFSERLPSIRRSRDEGLLRGSDLASPFAGEKSAAGRIAKNVGTDLYLVGSIEDFEVDPSTKQVSATVSVQLTDSVTGDILKSVVVTGKSPEGKTEATQSELTALAAGHAVAKVVSELVPGASGVGPGVAEPAKESPRQIVLPAKPRSGLAPRKMVLVFPLDVADSGAPAELGAQLAGWLKSSLGLVQGYMAMEFSERLPAAIRLRDEGSMKKTDLAGPFNDPAIVGKIAQAVGSDLHVMGTVEGYKLDSKAKKAEITLAIQVFDTNTGRNQKTVVVTGKSPEASDSISDRDLVAAAAANATANAVREIAPEAPMAVTADHGIAPGSRGKKRIAGWKLVLIGAAIAGGIALATRDKGGPSGTGGSGDVPPPPPY